jgi:hypothetical protein
VVEVINLEVFGIELNYLKQAVKSIIETKASGEITEAIEILILFLNAMAFSILVRTDYP